MRVIQLKISEQDFQHYQLDNKDLDFSELVEKINLEYTRKALSECQKIAKEVGLSEMTLGDIQAEVNAVRNAKNHS